MLHHILPESLMYSPSYLLAGVRAVGLEKNRRKLSRMVENGKGRQFLKDIMEKGGK